MKMARGKGRRREEKEKRENDRESKGARARWREGKRPRKRARWRASRHYPSPQIKYPELMKQLLFHRPISHAGLRRWPGVEFLPRL